MGVSQSAIAKLEAQEDLYLSTLARYAAGLGGRLELRVVFDDETVGLDLAYDHQPRRPGAPLPSRRDD